PTTEPAKGRPPRGALSGHALVRRGSVRPAPSVPTSLLPVLWVFAPTWGEIRRPGRFAGQRAGGAGSGLPEHGDSGPIHRAGRGGGEEENHVGDGGGLHPLAAVSARPLLPVLRRVDGPGQHAVDVDARLLQLVRQAFGEAHEGALRGAVSGIAAVAGEG